MPWSFRSGRVLHGVWAGAGRGSRTHEEHRRRGCDPAAFGVIPALSVVIPTLDAAVTLEAALRALGGVPGEVVVADGGSGDGTPALARRLGARVVQGTRGRGQQFAAGIAAASGSWLLLLHADTRLQPGWEAAVRAHLAEPFGDGPEPAGYFRFALDSADPRARRLERLVAWRCRAWSLPYGDQGLLVSRRTLDVVGGMPELALMEDVALVRRVRRRLGRGGVVALDAVALTSAARWERDGWWRRSVRNLACLGLWRLGVPAGMIARLYALRPRTAAARGARDRGAGG
jgi:rSAM/selenodomain-associated transferase 2